MSKESKNKSEEEDIKINFSEHVRKAIDDALQSSDALDSKDFNVVDYINQLFPNEQSLSNIDEIIGKIECEISLLDENVRTVVHEQANNAQDGRLALDDAQNVIEQLFCQIKDIKVRAEKTEEIVKEITGDIKQLDCAKKNLTAAITTLNHLHMLVGGIESLKELCQKSLYGEILNPLQAIIEVNRHFKEYLDIPEIKNLSNKIQHIQTELTIKITEDFHNAFSPKCLNMKPTLTQLEDACKIASVLEPNLKHNLIRWFINIHLEEYIQLFQESQDIAWLDKIDKRYAWLKRSLLDFENKFGQIFPVDWEISERISVEFCKITHKELNLIMSKRRREIDAKLLLFAISKTQNFEQLLAKRFSGTTLNDQVFDMNQKQKITHDLLSTNSLPIVKGFINLISSCFHPYLDIYIESIDHNLNELINKFSNNNKHHFDSLENKSNVYPSSADLFVFYKKCILQCTQLSNGKPMYSLAMVFKKYLREYASKILEMDIPKVAQTSISSSMSFLTRDLHNISLAAGQVIHNFLKEGEIIRFNKEELTRLCSIITTAEYCLETVQQLEEKLKEKIEIKYSEKIDLLEEKDIFHKLISNCIQLLVQDLENGCDPALNIMIKTQWQQINNVGDQSSFVNLIILNLKQTIPIIRDNLLASRKYFIQLCHRFINSFISKYINTIFKCRLTSDGSNNILGCEQLLLDTHSIKTSLLYLPSIGSNVERNAPSGFTNVVVKSMTKAEMIIKVVMAPINPATVFNEQVMNLLPDITIAEYQKILDMKSVKKSDQIHLIEIFKQNIFVDDTNATIKSVLTNENKGGNKVTGVENDSQDTIRSESEGLKRLQNILKRKVPG